MSVVFRAKSMFPAPRALLICANHKPIQYVVEEEAPSGIPLPPVSGHHPRLCSASSEACSIMRLVTMSKLAAESGYTERAVRAKIDRGDWLEGKLSVQWRRAAGVRICSIRVSESDGDRARICRISLHRQHSRTSFETSCEPVGCSSPCQNPSPQHCRNALHVRC